jgi:Cu(I)/Ag(I) efflux system periplasmic protein CusF
MTFNRYSLLLSLGLISGCAAYPMPPLSNTHPAHAEAMVASEPPISKTLAYTRADIPSLQKASAEAGEQHGRAGAPAAAAPQQIVEGEGKVIATVPSASQIVVEHGEIKGFMDAMTMGYRAEPASLLDGLKSGDRIRFTIDVPNKAIIKIDKLK